MTLEQPSISSDKKNRVRYDICYRVQPDLDNLILIILLLIIYNQVRRGGKRSSLKRAT